MAIIPPDNEKILLERIAFGDQQAYTQLYHHYAPEVFNVAMVYLRNDTEANEVVQEVFLIIWQKRASLTSIDSFRDYLFILARNKTYDGFKRKAIENTALHHFYRNSPASAVDNTDHRVQDRQYEELLQLAIDGLSPARKNVYIARNQGMTYEAIAAQYNITIATAKKQMTQARQFVQEFILRYLHIYALILINSHSLSALTHPHR